MKERLSDPVHLTLITRDVLESGPNGGGPKFSIVTVLLFVLICRAQASPPLILNTQIYNLKKCATLIFVS